MNEHIKLMADTPRPQGKALTGLARRSKLAPRLHPARPRRTPPADPVVAGSSRVALAKPKSWGASRALPSRTATASLRSGAWGRKSGVPRGTPPARTPRWAAGLRPGLRSGVGRLGGDR